MNEREPFDDRLAAAVRTFADGARTEVDAVEVADRAIDAVGRRRAFRSRTPVPTAVWLLILVALLLAAFAWGLSVGGGRPGPQAIIPPVPTITPLAVAPSPTPTPDPRRDAHVSGRSVVTLRSSRGPFQLGDEVQAQVDYYLREDVDDPRVAGFGTLTLETAGTADMSYGSGPIQIGGADGWEGTCSSASWEPGTYLALTCWLTGTGAYQGLSYYRYSVNGGTSSDVEGLIMSAPPPSP